MITGEVGTCCLVLHSHLPWLAHHGTWPVGEEWVFQAWAGSYLRVVDVLERLASEDRQDLLTLGVTPVLAAQLDDPYLLREFHTWLGDWQVRAQGLAGQSTGGVQDAASHDVAVAGAALRQFEQAWCGGGSPAIRRLTDSGVAEILGGPTTHPFQPALADDWLRFGLLSGLDDAATRLGRRPRGIWAPECGYRPGLEDVYAAAHLTHVVSEPTTLPSASAAGTGPECIVELGESGVLGFAHDRDLADLVWSPTAGYPGGAWYRDHHTFDQTYGLRSFRVTGQGVAAADKLPYDADRARRAVRLDADRFVSAVRDRLVTCRKRTGRPAAVVVAFDTELFGDWWYEGPEFLERVLRRLPDAGVRPSSLASLAAATPSPAQAHPAAGSWGVGYDDRVWQGAAVADLARDQLLLQETASRAIARERPTGSGRRPDLDQLAREVLLALSSDWAFSISHDSAAGYARDRFARHRDAVAALVASIERDDRSAAPLAADLRRADHPFGHLDARQLPWSGVAADAAPDTGGGGGGP